MRRPVIYSPSSSTDIVNTYVRNLMNDGAMVSPSLIQQEYLDLHHIIKRGASLVVAGGAYKAGTVYGFNPQSSALIPFTFTRADSVATRVNEQGLIEAACYNLLQQSETFDNAYWTKVDSTLTSNATTAPDGTTTADKLVESVAGGLAKAHFAYNNPAPVAVTAGMQVTHSIYVKAAERSIIRFIFTGTSANAVYGSTINFCFNTSTKSFFITDASSKIASYNYQELPNGWFRIWYTMVPASASGTLTTYIEIGTSMPTSPYVGDGVSGIYLWGAQLVQGTEAKPYLKTTDRLNVPRMDYDPVTKKFKGLLMEKGSTNLCLRSNEFTTSPWFDPNSSITEASGIANPLTGQNDLWSLTRTSTSLSCYIGQGVNLTVGTTYTLSIFAKAKSVGNKIGLRLQSNYPQRMDVVADLVNGTIDLAQGNTWTGVSGTITPFGNGIYRVSVTGTSSETVTAAIGTIVIGPTDIVSNGWEGPRPVLSDCYIYGAQLEASAYPTSYIPTSGSSVSRGSEFCSTTIGAWYNQNEGSMYAEHYMPTIGTVLQSLMGSDDGTTTNAIGLRVGNNGYGLRSVNGGTATQILLTTAYDGRKAKVSAAFKDNDFAAINNIGSVINTNTTATIYKSMTTFRLGIMQALQQADYPMKTIAYFPLRLPNTDLQAITV